MGFEISQGERPLSPDRKKLFAESPFPRQRELRGFLGMAGSRHMWILNFGLMAKPLYEAVKRSDELLTGGLDCQKDLMM